MKKAFALVLSVAMMLALGATAFAEPSGGNSNGNREFTDAQDQEDGRSNEWIRFKTQGDDVIVIDS